jgi:hypothetical protein
VRRSGLHARRAQRAALALTSARNARGAAAVVPPHVGPAGENAAVVAEFKGVAHGHGPLKGVVRVAQLSGTRVLAHAHAHALAQTLATHNTRVRSRARARVLAHASSQRTRRVLTWR